MKITLKTFILVALFIFYLVIILSNFGGYEGMKTMSTDTDEPSDDMPNDEMPNDDMPNDDMPNDDMPNDDMPDDDMPDDTSQIKKPSKKMNTE